MSFIKDEAFVRSLYRKFCLRSVSGRLSQTALTAYRVRVGSPLGTAFNQTGALTLTVQDGEATLLEILWHENAAWATRATAIDHAVFEADQPAFSNFVRRFLRKHGLIDKTGISTMEEVA